MISFRGPVFVGLATLAIWLAGISPVRTAERSSLSANGTALTVTTSHSVATFVRGDLVGLTNLLTNESYLNNPSAGQLANVDAIPNTGQSLNATNWAIAFDAQLGVNVATITLSDSARTMSLRVWIDPVSDEIAIQTSGSKSSPGLRAVLWSLAGLNVQTGRLIVPGLGGEVLTAANPQLGMNFDYPNLWQAQMVVYEAAAGSFVVYSRDTNYAFKRLRTSTRGGQTLDVAFGTEATGSYAAATTVPQVEWRLKSVAGNWQPAATIYRDWLNAVRPPVSTLTYPWVNNIRTVVTVVLPDTNVLTPLANLLTPSKTLIYLVQWSTNDFSYFPDYTPLPTAAPFVNAAHNLGFKVMLHTDMGGVHPTRPEYASLQQFQMRNAETMELMGWNWHLPPSTVNRYAVINPAASAYRQMWISHVAPTVAALQPDALHLDMSSAMGNDGNGIIEGLNYLAGVVQFHEDIRAAFPSLVLAGEGQNEILYRYHRFGQVLTFMDTPRPFGHPISSFLFSPSHRFYGHLGTPGAFETGMDFRFRDTITRGAPPNLRITFPQHLDMSIPDVARQVAIHQAWQANDFQLAAGDWQGDYVRWGGNGGAVASLNDVNGVLTLNAGGQITQQAHDVNQLTTSRFHRFWPAFDASTLTGLNPGWLYWLDGIARPTSTHVTALPAGVKSGLNTLISTGFAHIELEPVSSASFDAATQVMSAHNGTTTLGVDGPLTGGAEVRLGGIFAAGISRSGIFIHPPGVGETFAEYQVAVPTAASLSFGVGVDVNSCGDGVTFRITANGTQLFSQHVLKNVWLDANVSLAAYAGTTIALRIISNTGPANNPNCDWSLWSGVRISTPAVTRSISVPMSLAPSTTVTQFTGDGLLTLAAPQSPVVVNVPVPGRFTVFSGPGSDVGAGTALAALPFQNFSRARDEVAEPGSYTGGGTLSGGSAGGVSKFPTINGNVPFKGETTAVWVVKLPAGVPLRLNWLAGILDGFPTVDGVDFSVRLNGIPYWRLTSSANAWTAASLNLAPFAGQSILIELVTDSRETNTFDAGHWADVIFTAGGASCGYALPSGTNVGAAGGSFSLAVGAGSECPWLGVSSQPWLSVSAPAYGYSNGSVGYTVAANTGAPRTATIKLGGQVFTVTQAAGSPQVLQDVGFSGGFDVAATGWRTFALPGPSYLSTSVANGVVDFYRLPPPEDQVGQGTIFQNTFIPVPKDGGLEARFDLGNSSASRKRISVLLIEHDFSDIAVCTFWLAPASPLRTYRMRTHTTKAWTNASIYFYTATAGSDGGAYRLANVSLHQDPAIAIDRTDCVDAVAPPPTGVADGLELLTNGDFNTGTTTGWSLFGSIVPQVTGGVFEFYRPAANPDPAGVILQQTGAPLVAGDILTAQFDLGNSSNVRKRVTVLLHDISFQDLHACTFWLEPGQPLSTYRMRSYATEAWGSATISIYAATAGDQAWMRLDNVSLRKTPSAAIAGTDCLEPGSMDVVGGDAPNIGTGATTASNLIARPATPRAAPAPGGPR